MVRDYIKHKMVYTHEQINANKNDVVKYWPIFLCPIRPNNPTIQNTGMVQNIHSTLAQLTIII